MSTKLTRQQQSSYLMSEVLDYSCVIETQEGKYLMYSLKQISSNPFSVSIINVGEKTSKAIISITLVDNSIKVKKLVSDEEGNKLPDKYVFMKDGLHIASHTQVIESVVLPYFMDTALVAASKNMVAVQWLFISLLCMRLDIQHTSLSDKSTVKPFTLSDIAFATSSTLELAKKHLFPKPIVEMLEADFLKLPEDVRTLFVTQDAVTTDVVESLPIDTAPNTTSKKK